MLMLIFCTLWLNQVRLSAIQSWALLLLEILQEARIHLLAASGFIRILAALTLFFHFMTLGELSCLSGTWSPKVPCLIHPAQLGSKKSFYRNF